MQYCAYFGELARVSYPTACYFQKIAKHTVLFLFGTLNDDNAILDACCCISTTSSHNLSTLMRVSCEF
jgi:hypothetical protein